MAAYNASKMQAGVQPRYLPGAGGVRVFSSIALVAALLLNDTINWCQLIADPAETPSNGPAIFGTSLDSDALDAGNTLTLDLGDATAAQRFVAASNIGQAGGRVGSTLKGTLGYQPFAAAFNNYPTTSLQLYTIFTTVHAAPTNWANGTIRMLVDFSYDP